MKIKEVLELTQSEPLNKIAKERLTIGEKPTREALKKAGCYNVSGKKGWFYEGEKSVLEQSIYDFAPEKKINRQPKANVLTVPTNEAKEPKNKSTKENSEPMNKLTKEPKIEPTLEPTNQRSKGSGNVEVKQTVKETAPTKEQTNERTLEPSLEPTLEQTNEKTIVRKRASFDIDVELMKDLKIKAIIHDKNVYEMVETAIRQYLKGL